MISVEFEDASGNIGHFQCSRILSPNVRPFVDDATVQDQDERLTAIEVKHEELTRVVLALFDFTPESSDAADEDAAFTVKE